MPTKRPWALDDKGEYFSPTHERWLKCRIVECRDTDGAVKINLKRGQWLTGNVQEKRLRNRARDQATIQASCVPPSILSALQQAGAYITPGREEILFTGVESERPVLSCLPPEWAWQPYGHMVTYALAERLGDEALSTEAPLPGSEE